MGEAAVAPVPPGLAEPSAAQTAMIELLRIDTDLVAAAARAAAPADADVADFRRWVAGASTKDKNAWLERAATDPDLALGADLLRLFRASMKAGKKRAPRGRTLGELRALADDCRAEREAAEAAIERKQEAAAEAARRRRLTNLARDVDGAWARLETLIETSRYDDAVSAAADLSDLAADRGSPEDFEHRFAALRKQQARRRGFFDRWKRRR